MRSSGLDAPGCYRTAMEPSFPRWPRSVPAPDAPRTLALYKYDACPFCRRVTSVIDRLGLDVDRRDVLLEPEHRAGLMQATGRTTVPCLFIDGTPLFESADIAAWLVAFAERSAA